MIEGSLLDCKNPAVAMSIARNMTASGVRVADWYMVRMNLGHNTVDEAVEACDALEAIGCKTIPGIGHVLCESHGVVGPRAWFSRRTWWRAAKAVQRYHEIDPQQSGYIQLDLEPYWSNDVATRYPPNNWINRMRLRWAMRPLTRMLRRLDVVVLAMASEMVRGELARACVPVVYMDETTYRMPDIIDDDTSEWIRLKDLAGDPNWIPGFYVGGLRDTGFMLSLAEALGDHPYWWFIDADPWDVGK